MLLEGGVAGRLGILETPPERAWAGRRWRRLSHQGELPPHLHRRADRRRLSRRRLVFRLHARGLGRDHSGAFDCWPHCPAASYRSEAAWWCNVTFVSHFRLAALAL